MVDTRPTKFKHKKKGGYRIDYAGGCQSGQCRTARSTLLSVLSGKESGSGGNTHSIVATNLLKTVLREAEHYDLVVMGANQERLFQIIGVGRLPEEFAHRCQKPLVMVKTSSPVESMLSRWT